MTSWWQRQQYFCLWTWQDYWSAQAKALTMHRRCWGWTQEDIILHFLKDKRELWDKKVKRIWRVCMLEMSHTMRKLFKYIFDTFGALVLPTLHLKYVSTCFLVEHPFEIDQAVAFFVILKCIKLENSCFNYSTTFLFIKFLIFSNYNQ